MLSPREEVMEFIKTVPDNKIIYIMNLFNSIKGLTDTDNQHNPSVVDELYGMCADCEMTVDGFLAMTHDETEM